jgi:hypothetical protein
MAIDPIDTIKASTQNSVNGRVANKKFPPKKNAGTFNEDDSGMDAMAHEIMKKKMSQKPTGRKLRQEPGETAAQERAESPAEKIRERKQGIR